MIEARGDAIFTTSRISDIDTRVRERTAHIVKFPFPDEVSRRYIWRIMISPDLALADDIDVEALANRYTLSGDENPTGGRARVSPRSTG
jgi:hypothetical protein